MTLRVGLELTGLELDATGAGRAAGRLREELGQMPLEVVELRQGGGPAGWGRAGGRAAGAASRAHPGEHRARVRRIARGLYRELAWFPFAVGRRARSLGLDVLHCPLPLAPRSPHVPLVVTVNDALAFDRPEWFTRANSLHARLVLAPALRRAARVLVPSEFSRGRLIDAARLDPSRVVVTPYGVDARFSPGPRPTALLERLGVPGPYLLAVATLQPRKNLEGAVAAFEHLAAELPDHRLVVAGGRGWRDEQLAALLERSPRVAAAGALGDAELVGLYRGADCLVYPSRGEGFGFPLLEAMACGTPVVAARATSLPEVVGDAGVLVDPDDADSIADGIAEALRRRDELAQKGLARARGFTWPRCAELTVEAYRAAAG